MIYRTPEYQFLPVVLEDPNWARQNPHIEAGLVSEILGRKGQPGLEVPKT